MSERVNEEGGTKWSPLITWVSCQRPSDFRQWLFCRGIRKRCVYRAEGDPVIAGWQLKPQNVINDIRSETKQNNLLAVVPARCTLSAGL